jgi:hypothetical protein
MVPSPTCLPIYLLTFGKKLYSYHRPPLSPTSRCRRAAVPPHTTMASDVKIPSTPSPPSTEVMGDAANSSWFEPCAHQIEVTVVSENSTSAASHRALHVRRSLTNTPPKYYPIYCYMLHAIKTLFSVLSIRTLVICLQYIRFPVKAICLAHSSGKVQLQLHPQLPVTIYFE